MKIRYFLLLALVIFALIFSSCSNEVKEDNNIRISVYETTYDGKNLYDYPFKVFTNTDIIDMINSGTATDKIKLDEKVAVLYNLIYYNESGEEITLMLINTGEATTMRIGLPHRTVYLTEEELNNVLKMIEQ